MDYSAANIPLWNGMMQIALLCAVLIVANVLRRKVPLIRRSLLPTAVLAGFIALLLRSAGLFHFDIEFMDVITYHALGLGFIALSLRVPDKPAGNERQNMVGAKSGALIASCYVIQGILGLLISLALAYTVMPGMFKAAGILLPMGYGQGPGQANNIGSTYEALGFAGGRSFGLALAAAGFLCACIFGVIYLSILRRRGVLRPAQSAAELSGSLTVDTFQSKNEAPVSESVDRLSLNVGLVLVVYGLTYLLSLALTTLLGLAGLGGLADTLTSLIWGFNFLIGALLGLLVRKLIALLRRKRLMHYQYQNNYLLSRCSGLAFDLMVVSGLAAIQFDDLQGLWLPFALMALAGGFLTFYYLLWISKRLYPDYYYEGFFSMFGMMTGTISSGVLLLREIDGEFTTPAANNLLLGSSFAILFGAPVLALVGLAPLSDGMCWLTLFLLVIYMALLLLFLLYAKRRRA